MTISTEPLTAITAAGLMATGYIPFVDRLNLLYAKIRIAAMEGFSELRIAANVLDFDRGEINALQARLRLAEFQCHIGLKGELQIFWHVSRHPYDKTIATT